LITEGAKSGSLLSDIDMSVKFPALVAGSWDSLQEPHRS
jgi:hypothetical protein